MITETTALLVLLVALASGYLIGNLFPLPSLDEERRP